MRFKILQYFLILSLIAVFGLRLVLVYFTPLDSDEVMWSVMVERILSSGEHFVFFTDQNFRGSLEAYIILPFLYFFGLNEFTLRINSILFLGLTGFMIFKIIYYLTKKLELSLISVIVFLLPLPQILFTYNKAWGGYVAIQFFMLLVYFLFEKKILKNEYNNFNFYIPIIGLICGLSFWVNEQSIYFMFLIIFAGFYYDLRNNLFKFTLLNKILFIVFSIFNLLIVYLIIKKRMFLNFYDSVSSKFGLNYDFLNFNIFLKDIIFYVFLILTLFIISSYFIKKIQFTKSLFLNFASFSFIVLYINIINNSFSRIYNPEPSDLSKTFFFLKDVILNNFFGVFIFLFIALGLLGIYFRFKKAIKTNFQSFEIIDIILISLFSFPIMFLLSALPGLTATPRYLIIIWPIAIIALFYVLNYFILYSPKFKYLGYIFVVSWVIYFSFFRINIQDSVNLKSSQDRSYTKIVSEIKAKGYSKCVGNYWTVGLIFFYSDFEIKCFTSKLYGVEYKFLDSYKEDDVSKVYVVY
jgi:hypothetical protein